MENWLKLSQVVKGSDRIRRDKFLKMNLPQGPHTSTTSATASSGFRDLSSASAGRAISVGTVDAMALTRRKQINTLMIFNENVSEIQPGVHYSVGFDVRVIDDNGWSPQQVLLHIFLPPAFPTERPILRLESRGTQLFHPWLDHMGNVIGAPGLVNYTLVSDLGRVVLAVKRELEKNLRKKPNQEKQQQHLQQHGRKSNLPGQQSSQAVPNLYNQHNHPQSLRYPYHSAFTGPQNLNAATIPTHMKCLPELREVSSEQLRQMSQNDTAVKIFCRNLHIPARELLIKEIQASRDVIESDVMKNNELRDKRDKLKPEWEESAKELRAAKKEVAELRDDIEAASRTLNQQAITNKLNSASQEMEKQSDEIADAFLDGQLSADSFLKSYMESRSKFHTLKLKYDKLRLGVIPNT